MWPARRQPWLRPQLGTDLLFYLGQALVFGPLSVLALESLHPRLAFEVLAPVRAAVAAQPLAVQALEVVLLGDLCCYGFHRACHRFEVLWRFHRVHHSSSHLDWLAAHREHPLDGLLTQLAINLPAMALGVPVSVLLPLAVFRGLWAIYIHSNARLPLGPLRYLLGAPELHHWHHARDPERVANFGNLAPWCDLLFGTFHLPPDGARDFALGVPEFTPVTWWGQLAASVWHRRTKLPACAPASPCSPSACSPVVSPPSRAQTAAERLEA
ncbi:MAG: sterol desaturase family protein [Archangiaceae bacterium]|nr:sterol desaturase family protein [Archangiaceae bacterium]